MIELRTLFIGIPSASVACSKDTDDNVVRDIFDHVSNILRFEFRDILKACEHT